MLASLFPSYRHYPVIQPLVFGLSSVFLLILDTISVLMGQQSVSIKSICFTLILIAVFMAAGWFQPCEFIFIACYLLFNLLDLIDGYGMVVLDLDILLVFWLIRSWIIPAVLVLLLEGVISVAVSATPGLQAFSSALIAVIVLVIGLALRWQNARRILAEHDREQIRKSTVQTRKELARQLHDTTAKDLAHVTVLAQDIAVRHPELSSEMNPLVQAATKTSRRIRPMILSIDTAASKTPLSEVVQQVKRMLQTRRITLDTVLPENLDNALSRQQLLTGALAIRECSSNILKYAPADSEANLIIELQAEQKELTLSLSNEIADTPATTGISSGYGLANLDSKIREEGGTMEITNLGGQWLTYIVLPTQKHKSKSLSVENTSDDGAPSEQ